MRDCVDEGVLQSYLDGELMPEMTRAVAGHIGVCDTCANALGEAESETAIYATATAPETSFSVPTEHLRERVNEAIAMLDATATGRAIDPEPRWRTWLTSFGLPARRPALSFAVLLLLIGAAVGGMRYLDARKNTLRNDSTSRANGSPKSPAENGGDERRTVDKQNDQAQPGEVEIASTAGTENTGAPPQVNVARGPAKAGRVSNSTAGAKRRRHLRSGPTLAEREAAKERLMFALQIAGTKLHYTQKKVMQNIYRQPVS